MLKKGNVSVHLHRASGEVLNLEEKNRGSFEHALGVSTGMSLDGGMDFSIMALFPWGPNALEECWFEVRIGQECYWVEVPYGFDQDPKNLSVRSIAGGPPTNAPAMKQLSSHDHVVHWEKVQYDLGNLPGGWNVSLNQSNPFHASSEVILYRENWPDRNLFTPRISARLVDVDGSIRNGFCWAIHLVDDGMRRSDTFHLGGSDDKMRCWSQIEISVDATNTCRTIIPSSLYKYCHGHGYAPIR